MSHNTTPTPTQSRTKRMALAASVSALLLSLAACGGGGSDSTPSTPSAPATPSTPVADQPVMDVPAPTYAPDSPEMAAYNLLNDERARCGFGRLAQNTKLDYAAKMHGLYLQANQTIGHDEDPTKPAFYGATPEERATKAGYAYSAGEAIGFAEDAVTAMRALLAAPYHATLTLDTQRLVSVGMAFVPFGGIYSSLTLALGGGSGLSVLPGVRTYPCEGTVGVLAKSLGESPNPFPGQEWGQPVYVQGEKIVVTAASITGPLGDVPILGKLTSTGSVAIVPARLTPSTIYTVTVNGTNKGQPFTKTFRFQTGPR